LIPTPIRHVFSTIRKHQVQALLMGSLSCVFYGAAQFSRDVDSALLAAEENFARLRVATPFTFAWSFQHDAQKGFNSGPIILPPSFCRSVWALVAPGCCTNRQDHGGQNDGAKEAGVLGLTYLGSGC
jgi:hypothetical protein